MHFPKFYYPTYCCSTYGSHCNEMWNQIKQMHWKSSVNRSTLLRKSRTLSFMFSQMLCLINRKGLEKEKKRKKRQLTRGEFQQWAGWGNTATLLWGLHTRFLKKKHTKGFLDFQTPEESIDLSTDPDDQHFNLGTNTRRGILFKTTAFLLEMERTWDCHQRVQWC